MQHRLPCRALLAATIGLGSALTFVSPALAHGFAGQPYVLPAPLALYLVAGGAVVLLSFALVAAFVDSQAARGQQTARLSLPALARPSVVTAARVVGGAIGILALAIVLVVGWLGPQDPPTANLAEYVVWIYFWAFLVIVTGLIGNLWALVNPWSALYDLGARLAGRRTPWPPLLPYPRRLGWWPAAFGYLAFAWLELASGISSDPAIIATAAAIYTVYTLLMLALFGRDVWLRNGEVFSVLFNLIARFGPVEVRATGAPPCASCHSGCPADGSACINCYECFRSARSRDVALRPWAVGLLTQAIEPAWDRVLFIILTLSTLAFDGILATGPWNALLASFHPADEHGEALIRTIGLLGVTAIFFLAYLVVITAVDLAGGGRRPLRELAVRFALTLVPIALVYNAAHNYLYMFLIGQGGLEVASDPFGLGWNVFGTRRDQVVSTVLTAASTVWYVQLLLIVLGHVIAVYLAHRRAASVYPSGRTALASQYPLLVLMVLYTMTSLWILAQPITQEA